MSGVFSIAYNVNNENLLEGSFVYLIFVAVWQMTIKIEYKTFEMIKLADGILPVTVLKFIKKKKYVRDCNII